MFTRKWWLGIFVRVFMSMSLLGLIAVAVIFAVYGQLAKSYDLSRLGQMPERTVVLDRNGQLLGRMHGENRIVLPLEQVPPHFIKALLVREDARFHSHHGVDYIGVARAFLRNLRDRRIVQGASTITMQLARNSFPDLDDRSFHRKLLEMMIARRIEKRCSKEQILEHYINRIFFGNGLYGIQRASQVYFGKHASQLTLSESALIVGIVRGPTKFSPFRNFDGALRERDEVLRRMAEARKITAEEELAARYEDLALHAQPAFTSQGGYALDAVKRDLDLILEQQEVEDGGLQVFTTLDQTLQSAAEAAMENRLRSIERLRGYEHPLKAAFDAAWDGRSEVASTPYLQGAITVLDNQTGGILAAVGGRDYRQSKYNRAFQAERQIGSTVKPFVYAAAIRAGLLPGTLVEDAPLRPGEIAAADRAWSPGNSDGQFLGWQPLITGLVQSRNAMTIRAGNHAGLDHVMELLSDAGIGQAMKRTPQIFIGNLGASVRQLTSAFAIFPNQGVRLRPFLIDRILDKNGRLLYQTPPLEVEVISPGAAHLVHRMLARVMDQGTAATARTEHGFHEPAGGKTGTTNDYRDAWFCGYTDRLTCGVWIGFDQPRTIIEDGYASRLAVPIWADVMKNALTQGYKPGVPRANVPVSAVALCRVSGQLATNGCYQQQHAYQDEIPFDLVPQRFCEVHGDGGPTSPSEPAAPSTGGFWGRVKRWFQ